MRKADLLILANKNLWRRKVRTILTCMGVVIGTASIVVMISLGIGLQASMEESMARWGDLNIIQVNPGMHHDPENPEAAESTSQEEVGLDEEAVEKFKSMPGVSAVSPTYEVRGEAQMGREEGHFRMVGVDVETMEELEFSLQDGRLPRAEESYTVVAGPQVINTFRDPRVEQGPGAPGSTGGHEEREPTELLEESVQVTFHNRADRERQQRHNFFVVGILDDESMQRSSQVYASLEDIDRIRDFVYEGIEDARQETAAMGGQGAAQQQSRQQRDQEKEYDSIKIRADSIESARELSDNLRDMGYNAYSASDALEGVENTSRTIQAILGGIGGITLLVAALSITNTMVMSIYERTKEIGVIKVIGASASDIRAMFLTEASLIGFFGGVIGLAVSYGASHLLNQFAGRFVEGGIMPVADPAAESVQISIIPVWLALFALGFAILIGLISGLYPAMRAIKLSPIVAIRNE
ncbi:ABC transporter permease [Natranaerobius thermophilus]|uniref:ABC3 transporter permease protein domain-containing protein n=1 Tax=Natranaerobius thermophilus (strain ATCC BAA-1301 / DSM 18059 / JW/NM-WN-LF) TaxID=457570 RepID=B2A273_NATTJ|nr:ABC transporter permease [Natranaerobius thermophilus]ACB86181.1 protein of unknown function DUF214 [Natranaerobius thermophilus JW/NM-WN-LF]